ncbi:MAG: ankyrin repeat domain-containing protein [Nitrospirota bacterium]
MRKKNLKGINIYCFYTIGIILFLNINSCAYNDFQKVSNTGYEFISGHLQENYDGICLKYGKVYETKQKKLREIVSEYEYKEDLTDKIGNNIMFFAIMANDISHVKKFVNKGASLKVQDGTLFHHAAHYASNDVLDFLLSKGLNQDETNQYGATPLMVAAFENRIEAVKWFIAHGANINAKAKNEETALSYAVVCRNKELIHEIIRSGAELTNKAVEVGRKRGIDLNKEASIALRPATDSIKK